MKRAALSALVFWLGAGGAPPLFAQQSVDYASVSGRVTDPSGAVVPGAQVTVRQTETNLTGTAVADEQGRFRFPYLRVGPYEITVRQQGFRDATRLLTLTVGAAFELPVVAHRGTGGDERHRHRRGHRARGRAQPDRGHGVADRGQEPAPERAQFPRSRAPGSRRLPDQRRRHAALSGDVGRSGPGHLRGQPAQPLQQLHRGRPVRQRRRRRPERHLLQRRRGRRVPGRHLGRPGRAGARAGRLRQRDHEKRHQRLPRRPVRLLPRRPPQRAERPFRHHASDDASAVRRESRRPHRPRPDLLLRRTSSAATSIRPASSPSRPPTSARSTPGWPRSATRARRSRPGSIPITIDTTHVLAKVDHQFSEQGPVQHPLQPLRPPRRRTRATRGP